MPFLEEQIIAPRVVLAVFALPSARDERWPVPAVGSSAVADGSAGANDVGGQARALAGFFDLFQTFVCGPLLVLEPGSRDAFARC